MVKRPANIRNHLYFLIMLSLDPYDIKYLDRLASFSLNFSPIDSATPVNPMRHELYMVFEPLTLVERPTLRCMDWAFVLWLAWRHRK